MAYQYEFNGGAKASTSEYSIDVPSLKGSTVIEQLGMTIALQNAKSPLIDISVQGYVGKNKGVGGNVEATWKF